MLVTKNKQVYENSIIKTKTKPVAESVIFPESLQEIQNLIKTSSLDIVPRGAGINFSGSTIPLNSIILDTSKMNKIVNFDSNRKVLEVEPGATLDQVNKAVSKNNLEFPINPLFSNLRTLGGLIATNSSGSREIKYGKIKNWIEGLEVINGKSEILNISRSDLDDFAGMEGTTGVITKIKLKLTTKKTRSISIFKTNNLGEAISLSKKLKLDQEVSMVYMLDNTLSLLSGLERKYHIFIEFESNRGTFKQESYEKITHLLDSLYYILANNGYTLLENPKFFLDSLEEFLLYLEENHIPYFVDLSSGSVFYSMKPTEQQKHLDLINKTKRLRGILAYNFGIGITKKQFLDKNEKELISRIKIRQDPKLKLNRDKLIDLEYLKNILSNKGDGLIKEKQKQLAEQEKKEEQNQEGLVQPMVQLLDELKTPEEKLEEFIKEQEIDDELQEILESKPVESSSKSNLPKSKCIEESSYLDLTNKQKQPFSEREPEIGTKDQRLESLHELIKQNTTIQNPRKKLSKEEEEKIKKIAGGFFG